MNWAVNEVKLRRAQAKCGKDASEADVKAEYIKLGGLMRHEEVAIEHEVADVVIAPKKKAKK